MESIKSIDLTILNGFIGRNDMKDAAKFRKNIHPGIEVKIILKGDRAGKNPIVGIVKNILTNAQEHAYGIMVELENGQIGRVCEILSKGASSNESSKSVDTKQLDPEKLILDGETESVEYKSSALWSYYYTKEQIEASQSAEIRLYGKQASKVIIAKTIAAFLNSKGGNLFIGVKEIKETGEHKITGVESEFSKLRSGDQNQDGYRRMILDNVIRPYFRSKIFNHFNEYMVIKFHKINGKLVCWVEVKKSDTKVFLKLNNKDHFYVKIDTEIHELSGEDLVDYCNRHFQ